MNADKGKLLRIYVAEADKHGGLPVYEWIVQQARDFNMAGATVLRGMEGFGAKQHMHTAKVLRLAQDLPVVVEIVDTDYNIARFLDLIDEVLQSGLTVVSDVQIHSYSKSGETD